MDEPQQGATADTSKVIREAAAAHYQEPQRPIADALIASGGICAPISVRYDFFGSSDAPAAPVRRQTYSEVLRARIMVRVFQFRSRVGRWVAGGDLCDHDSDW